MGLIKLMVKVLWSYFNGGVLKAANGGTGSSGGSLNLTEQAVPAVSASGATVLYSDATTHITMISQNGGPFIPVVGALEMTSIYTNYLAGNPIGAL